MSKTDSKKSLQERLEDNWKSDTYKDHPAFYIAPEDKEEKIFLNDNTCINYMRENAGLKGEPIQLTKADYKQQLEALKSKVETGYPTDKPATKWTVQQLSNWLNEKDVQFDVDAKKADLLSQVQEKMKELETPK